MQSVFIFALCRGESVKSVCVKGWERYLSTTIFFVSWLLPALTRMK
jgi:hypothetical protein